MCGISGGFDAESHLSLSDWTKLYKKKSSFYQQILGCPRHEIELIIFCTLGDPHLTTLYMAKPNSQRTETAYRVNC